jgi:putative ABC transport system permease protein
MTTRKLGGEEVANKIYIYPIDFDSKNLVTDYLDAWNDEHEEDQITYTDSLELVINIINEMIDIITSALIAFTSISLVVSSVMIGVITYVSVVERTKEIGVLRSLGARKIDVSNLFNAETFIIGLLAGVVGVVITYLISLPVNLILGSITGIYTLLSLPIGQAFLMICVSFVLTMISGLIPARAAAKKDPVIALRTE